MGEYLESFENFYNKMKLLKRKLNIVCSEMKFKMFKKAQLTKFNK